MIEQEPSAADAMFDALGRLDLRVKHFQIQSLRHLAMAYTAASQLNCSDEVSKKCKRAARLCAHWANAIVRGAK